MINKQTLLIIAPHYDSFIKGSGEELSKQHKEIFVIIPKWKKLVGKKIFETVDRKFISNKKNIKIIEIPVPPIPQIAWKKINKYLRKKNICYDSILSHFIVPYGYIGNKLGEYNDAKSIIIGHGFDVYKFPFKNIVNKTITKKILREADEIITVSESNKKCLKKLGFEKKTTVIPNGFDEKIFKPMNKITCRKKLNLSAKGKIILTVGNLVPIKNQTTLIKAMKEIILDNPSTKCFIVGEGYLRKKLQKEIKKLNLEKNVFLVGAKPHSEISVWMNAADIFVLPSINESFGVVQLEAAACEMKIIVSKKIKLKNINSIRTFRTFRYKELANEILSSNTITKKHKINKLTWKIISEQINEKIKLENKEITVLIPTLDRLNDLKETIESIECQTYQPKKIVIVDQTETNQIKKYCKNYSGKIKLEYIHLNAKSLTKAKNKGVQNIQTELTSILDDDITLQKNYFQEINKTFNKHKKIIGLTGELETLDKEPKKIIKIIIKIINMIFQNAKLKPYSVKGVFGNSKYIFKPKKTKNNLEWMSGGYSTYKQKIFNEILFENKFKTYSYKEDVDFSNRVFRKHRESLYYNPNLKAIHRITSKNRKMNKNKARMRFVYFIYIYLKHNRINLSFWVSIFGDRFLRLIFALNRRDFSEFKEENDALKFSLKHLKKIKKGRVDFDEW